MILTDIEKVYLELNFRYEKSSGKIFWKNRMCGKEAGSLHKESGRWQMCLNGKRYKRYQLVFFFETGLIPDIIDHKDRNQSNDMFSNLRVSGSEHNAKNASIYNSNTSEIKGVCVAGRDFDAWQSYISFNGKQKNLYYGRDYFEACCKRKSAELTYQYEGE